MPELRPVVVGLGEILWDLLPGGRQPGGAPFNFTFHCHQLGHPSAMVSRVGRDPLGDELRAVVRGLRLTDNFLQVDPHLPTGTVDVQLDQGQPQYEIIEPVAYDFLAWEDSLGSLIRGAKAICFGTLCQRNEASRSVILRAASLARENGAVVVYDVNLRQHFFNREILEASLKLCHWAKLNQDELLVLRELLSLAGDSDSALVRDLRERFGPERVALTRGEHGCLVQTRDEEVDQPGIPVCVADTVGAGDAFTAGLVAGHLEGQRLADAVSLANRLAARVASLPGGTPRLDRAEL